MPVPWSKGQGTHGHLSLFLLPSYFWFLLPSSNSSSPPSFSFPFQSPKCFSLFSTWVQQDILPCWSKEIHSCPLAGKGLKSFTGSKSKCFHRFQSWLQDALWPYQVGSSGWLNFFRKSCLRVFSTIFTCIPTYQPTQGATFSICHEVTTCADGLCRAVP